MKKNFVLLVWACVACTNTPNSGENENIAHVKSMFDAFNRHDWKTMSEHYADSAQFLDPSFGPHYVIQSRSDIVKKYQELEQMFPNVSDQIVNVFAAGNTVAVEFISTGNSGDSISLRLPISAVLTLQNGLIVKDATYYNNCQE
jgi:ketosteroid isomerase-like protein